MASIEKIIAGMRNAPQYLAYIDLRKVCVHFFGEPRESGTSHTVFERHGAAIRA